MNKLTTILIAVVLVPVMTVYADHVDNNIWIETAEGRFVIDTGDREAKRALDNKATSFVIDMIITGHIETINGELHGPFTFTDYSSHMLYIDRYKSTTINGYKVWDNRNNACGNETSIINKHIKDYSIDDFHHSGSIGWWTDESMIHSFNAPNDYESTIYVTKHEKPFENAPALRNEQVQYERTINEIIDERSKTIHDKCSYWYANTIQDEYAYTIIDLPRDRELPPNYKNIVATGIQAGFDRWADINDIDFRYTDSRLQADIIIQQQIGNGKAYGNAVVGCLFEEAQCTIQLFTDVNVGKQQTLVNTNSIEWTVAHEFGHLIGLPHHIEPDHIMNTVHANNVRDYWEARNINVPRMTEPTHEQRLLENDNDYLDYANYIPTDIDEIMGHSTVTEFIEFMKTVLYNMTESDRAYLWTGIMGLLTDAIFS